MSPLDMRLNESGTSEFIPDSSVRKQESSDCMA
jgi:hypothetical protein